MNALYRQLGYSKQSYHQQVRRDGKKKVEVQGVKKKVEETRKLYPGLGSRRIHKTAGIKEMGITRFEEFMSREGLTIQRSRKWIKTTDSRGHQHVYPNLTNGLKVLGVNELVVGDLTYLINSSGVYYLFLLTDVYSLRIVGWEASKEKRSCYARDALEKMIELRGEASIQGMIHHTDRGSEYRSNAYIGRLQELGVEISMAETCIENGYAERINGIIKNDYLAYMDCSSLKQVRKSLEQAVSRYGDLAHKAGLKYSPIAYETWVCSLPPDQRPVLEMFDFGASRLRKAQMLTAERLGQPNQIPRCPLSAKTSTKLHDSNTAQDVLRPDQTTVEHNSTNKLI